MSMPDDRDAGRVAAERGDVLLDPVQGGHLIHQAEIASWRVVERRKEPWSAKEREEQLVLVIILAIILNLQTSESEV